MKPKNRDRKSLEEEGWILPDKNKQNKDGSLLPGCGGFFILFIQFGVLAHQIITLF
ncbi:hypothetical protein ABGT24_02890 [Peribacillus frigoritolerans]|jgi:hypothetical protein|uniref:hypothetical protein n=1 Tax=Bacillaceae TaxID=186817 RepID=UPI0012FF3860|nr:MULTISPECIES: hypothetical protein [Bacillaceae]MCT4476533.1 hypothetical protein [Peribacillus frigoritolerans]MCY9139913.1 hypothetical protein [Peribacillus frigoritolerans]MDF1998351.1 hypothetical protein [Peribacillus frigoritolerans]MDM5305249.1 hypothetical protein [Peribacillus frigoritolerans]MED4691637.1 hypothetical protein [Peribacillus frigoritolerans]